MCVSVLRTRSCIFNLYPTISNWVIQKALGAIKVGQFDPLWENLQVDLPRWRGFLFFFLLQFVYSTSSTFLLRTSKMECGFGLQPIGDSGSLSDGRKGRRNTYCLNPEGRERERERKRGCCRCFCCCLSWISLDVWISLTVSFQNGGLRNTKDYSIKE